MIKLVGTPLNNYVATVRRTTSERPQFQKSIRCQYKKKPSEIEPNGKVPYISFGALTEVNVIFIIWKKYSKPTLYPGPWETKAKEMEGSQSCTLMAHLDL